MTLLETIYTNAQDKIVVPPELARIALAIEPRTASTVHQQLHRQPIDFMQVTLS